MIGKPRTFFDGLSTEERAVLCARLERRSFPADSVVVAEGDERHEIYVVHSGTAEVHLVDREGSESVVHRIGPGATLGEIAFFTGAPASATVRAATDLELFVLDEADFVAAAASFPRLHFNIGAILAERLATTARSWTHPGLGRVAFLLDSGAPPVLAYALAASLAWHTREATALVLDAEGPLPGELADLAGVGREAAGARARRATVVVASNALRLEALRREYGHVLVQLPQGSNLPPGARGIGLAASGHRPRPGEHESRRFLLRGWTGTQSPTQPDREGVLDVPALQAADERELRQGLLPASTPAGRALGWMAREIAGLKVGLALGAGTARGYAHIGVLTVLERAGVTVDCITGSSIGAAVAGLFALGYSPDRAADALDRVGSRAFQLTLPGRSILSSKGVSDGVREICGDTRIEDLPIPLAVVAADLGRGCEVVFRHGLLWPAIVASLSIPGVYPCQRMGDYMLVDGGIVAPVPSATAAELGAGAVIAVKLARRRFSPTAWLEATEPHGKGPSALQAALVSLELMQSKISVETAAAATIVIEPEFQNGDRSGLRGFRRGRPHVALGEQATEAALPRIAAVLPWLRPESSS